MDYVANRVEQAQGARDSHGCPSEPEDYQVADHHEVDADARLDDQKVSPGQMIHQECVNFLRPLKCVVSQAFTLRKHLLFFILDECERQERNQEQACEYNARNK